MGLKPVITLPYNSKKWDPRQIMEILNTSNDLGIDECIWQLGSGEFNVIFRNIYFTNQTIYF